LSTELPKETKLVVLPEQLVERLRGIALRQGVSLSSFASEALEQAVRAEEMGASLGETVDMYGLHEVTRASGAIQIPRSNFDAMIGELYRGQKDELLGVWERAGRWYGEYLRARLGGGALAFFEKALMASWNLDEVEVEADGLVVELRFTSFTMSLELTELLVSYISGAMDAFGYTAMGEDHLRGLATLSYRLVPSR